MEERRVRLDGLEVRWLETGDGVPVVLVHGIPTSPRLWRHVMPRLAGVRALAWEMVGYGDSWRQGEGRDISVRAQVAYLLRWLDAIDVPRAVFVGHDLDHRHGPAAFVRQIQSLRTQDTLAVADRLRTLDVPAALVWGAADRFQKIEYGRRLAADLRVSLDAIEGGKHFVPEDHPDRVVAAIDAVAQAADASAS